MADKDKLGHFLSCKLLLARKLIISFGRGVYMDSGAR